MWSYNQLAKFQVVTDHKNLEHFFSSWKLTEWHVQWFLFLSQFNFQFQYWKGSENERADALSQCEQDLSGDEDPWEQSHMMQLFTCSEKPVGLAMLAPTAPDSNPDEEFPLWLMIPPSENDMMDDEQLWEIAANQNEQYQEATQCVRKEKRRFLTELQLKISISECSLDNLNRLRFWNQLWVPHYEPLHMRIIQQGHYSRLAGHPRQEPTYSVVSWEFFWLNMPYDVWQLVQNCNVCGRTKAWKERRRDLLHPLPVSVCPWKEVSMDFITEFSESEGCMNVLVITDRLSKSIILEAMGWTIMQDVAWVLVQSLIGKHGIPRVITSDWGSQFVNDTWKWICSLLSIEQWLSTAYHPGTDGSTEWMNSVVECYLRAYTVYNQHDWYKLLPMAELAINEHPATSTGMSSFFLSHGYDLSSFSTSEDSSTLSGEPAWSPIQKGEAIVWTLQEASEWAQVSMTWAQQNMKHQANH